MDAPNLRETFDCDLEVDNLGNPAEHIVLLGSPVGTDAFVGQHVVDKATKVDDVLEFVRPLDDAEIVLPIHRICLSVVLFTHNFRRTPTSHIIGPAQTLDAQQSIWLDRLLPALPPLNFDAVKQARLPFRSQGLRLTAPSDVFLPAFLCSRLDTANSLARLCRSAAVSSTTSASEKLLNDHARANNIQATAAYSFSAA